MAYVKTTWQNSPSTNTPINATNLNHIEQGIYEAAATADQAESGVEALDPRMDLVEQRLDNLIPQGTPTEGNAELIDIRVGANGVTYPTAGDAVRGQVTAIKSALSHDILELSNIQKLSVQFELEDGGINSSGSEISGANYSRTPDYYSTSENADILKFLVNSTSSYACYVVYYNSSQVFDSRVAVDENYALDTTKDLFRLSFYKDGGRDNALFRSWISWVYSDETDKRFNAIEGVLHGFVTFGSQYWDGEGFLIEMGNARYNFKRVTNNNINLYTWRLYKGSIVNGTKELIMWENSDAEGVIRLVGEDDYIGGYHGDEIYQSIDMFIDGVKIDTSTPFSRKSFKTIAVCVTSKVYHADTNTQAFTRAKFLTFEDGKVTIGNHWTAVGSQTIQQAPLMLFQCNKNNTDSELIFTNYEVDADYKVYSTSDASTSPSTNDYAKSARFMTKYGDIEVNVEQIDKTYDSEYRNVTMASFLTSQSRLKVYFNTIRDKVAGTAIADGQSIVSRFSFIVK